MVNYTSEIEQCIGELIQDFHAQKFAYIWEDDLRARLYVMLFEKLKDDPQFRGTTNLDPNLGGESAIVALHCQAKIEGTKQHVDIGIWDLKSQEGYDTKKIDLAIEIKYNWEKSLTKGLRKEAKKDLRKMKAAGIKHGYFLGFLARSIPEMQDPEKGAWEELLRMNGRDSYVLYIITPSEGYNLRGTTWEIIP